ncbi:MAG: hypothetical protein MZU91_05235 [Desulfosudis oleivorans]|nr:hypothetical protein [Desulfosudis oleivorans]
MVALAVVALTDMLTKWYGYLFGSREMISTEVLDYRPIERDPERVINVR